MGGPGGFLVFRRYVRADFRWGRGAENPMLGTAGQMGTGGWMGQDVKAVPRTE